MKQAGRLAPETEGNFRIRQRSASGSLLSESRRVDTPNSPVPLNLYFVIVDEGKEFREVLNTDALLSVCKRVR
jgi:hypothetical protein